MSLLVSGLEVHVDVVNQTMFIKLVSYGTLDEVFIRSHLSIKDCFIYLGGDVLLGKFR